MLKKLNNSYLGRLVARERSIFIIIFFIILPFIFFLPVLSGKIFLVGDFTGSDLLDLHLAFKKILHDNYTNFKIPLWEPRLAMGFPVLAEGQSGVFYPLNVILSFLPEVTGLTVSVILVFIFSSIFTYFYSKSIGLDDYAAIFAAITFSYSSFFIFRIKHLNLVWAAAWFPFVLFCIRQLNKEKNLFYAFLGATGLTMQILIGHPQITYYSFFICVIYFFFEVANNDYNNSFWKGACKTVIGYFILLFFLPFLLGAVQLIPTYELVKLSPRFSYDISSVNSFPYRLKFLFTFLLPYFFGNPAKASYNEAISESGIFWENNSYIGLIPIVLVFYAVVKYRKMKIIRYLKFYIFLSIFSFLLMLGTSTFVFLIFTKILPGFSLFRFPSRFSLFLIFSFSIIAGMGAEKLSRKLEGFKLENRDKRTESFNVKWPFKLKVNRIILLTLIVLDLYLTSASYIKFISVNDLLRKPAFLDKLDGGIDRVYSSTQYGVSPYSRSGWMNNEDEILAIRQSMPPNNNMLFNQSDFTDRGWFEGGLSVYSRNRIENYLLQEDVGKDTRARVLGAYNVRYFVTRSDDLGSTAIKIDNYVFNEFRMYEFSVFENIEFLPRVYLVSGARGYRGDFIGEVLEKDFDPKSYVYLENINLSNKDSGLSFEEFNKNNTSEIMVYKNDYVEVNVDVSNNSFLVFNDIYYPGWKAIVDGRDTEILKANGIVRAVEVTPGDEKVVFYYDPISFKVGALISLASVSIVLVCLMILYKKNR